MIIELKAENEFRLTPESLEAAITPKTKLLVMPFPNNPTGAIMEKKDLENDRGDRKRARPLCHQRRDLLGADISGAACDDCIPAGNDVTGRS